MDILIFIILIVAYVVGKSKKQQLNEAARNLAEGKPINAAPGQQNVYKEPVYQQKTAGKAPVRQAEKNTQKQAQKYTEKKYEKRTPEKGDILRRANANVNENAEDMLDHMQMDSLDFSNFLMAQSETSELMKEVNDLMITGYNGELTFERDFVAEGIEMLNSYEVSEGYAS